MDVRVLAATNHDLETAIRDKLFREDLYYRLNVVSVTLPPLRQRKEDIPKLTQYFLGKYGKELGISAPSIRPEALDFLQTHSWPGNVRELENVIRKSLLLAQDYTINADHIRTALNKEIVPGDLAKRPLGEYIDDLLATAQRGQATDVHARLMEAFTERELFKRAAIELAHGNQAKASRWLGVSRITMKAKLVQFGLHPKMDNEPESE